MIAALFVETNGPYFNVSGVDPWDITRDARNYTGPFPVVAHPPCQLWGKFAKINYARWGGEHNRPGNDGGCFKFALDSVRAFGGVLEHPANSYAWKEYGLTKPLVGHGWTKTDEDEYVCEVFQSAYGHLAAKRTWLFCVSRKPPKELRWDRKKGTHQIGAPTYAQLEGRSPRKPTLSGKLASRTPTEFRDVLIELAKNANE